MHFGADRHPRSRRSAKDVRDVEASDLEGFDAVIHLAAVCNDPVGNLNPQATYDINHLASVRVAEKAKEAGVARFLFASSCSLYGKAGDEMLDESAEFAPVTAYGRFEGARRAGHLRARGRLFHPDLPAQRDGLRRSRRGLRVDVVVNNLVGYACTTGEVLIQSDGTPWRPLVHVEDISAAFLAVLDAPRELVHDEAFNVGASSENYRIREVAEIVEEVVPGARASFAEGGGPDKRSYQVDCSKIARVLPEFEPQLDGAPRGRAAPRRVRPERADASRSSPAPGYLRINRVRELQEAGRLDDDLRWRCPSPRVDDASQPDRARADDLRPHPARGRVRDRRWSRMATSADSSRARSASRSSRSTVSPMRVVQSSTIHSPTGTPCAASTSRRPRIARSSSCAARAARSSWSWSTCDPIRRAADRWLGVELSSRDGRLAYVPEGFAQGYQTLEDDTEVLY